MRESTSFWRPIAASVTAAALLLTTTGCATLVHGRTQQVSLAVTPPATKVSIYRWTGELVAEGTSPQELTVPRPKAGQPYLVKATHEGHCPRFGLTDVGQSPMGNVETALLVVTLGIIFLVPIIIDANTGAFYSFDGEFGGTLEGSEACAGSK